jgi:hypothetical protein
MHLMVLLGDEGQVEALAVHLEIVLMLMQDKCIVCVVRTTGSKKHFGCSQWNS